MIQYFFILGRNPTLSTAEIISVLTTEQISFAVDVCSAEMLIVSSSVIIDAKKMMETLGGTIKMGQIIGDVNYQSGENEFYDSLSAESILGKFALRPKGKIHLGISIYDAGGDKKYISHLYQNLKSYYMFIKEDLKKKGYSVGFVQIKDLFLSSVSVAKNSLLDKGVEIVLLVGKDSIFFGKTLTVQEFEAFSLRDFQRPAKDKKSGILPSKLAHIMLNLAQVSSTSTILDPFCGSGTIIQEAIMLNYINISGSDISNKATSDTKRNIDWLYHLPFMLNKQASIKIFQCPVEKLSTVVEQNSVDAIVTEPYLGPPLYKKPSFEMVKIIKKELTNLYIKAFMQFFQIVKPKGKIVIIFPVFILDRRFDFLDILNSIKQCGFGKLLLIPAQLTLYPELHTTERGTIIYGDDNQFLNREILTFQKK